MDRTGETIQATVRMLGARPAVHAMVGLLALGVSMAWMAFFVILMALAPEFYRHRADEPDLMPFYLLALLGGSTLLFVAFIAVLQGGYMRAAGDATKDPGTLTVGAVLRHSFGCAIPAMFVTGLQVWLITLGTVLCFAPGVLVGLLTWYALPLVAVRRLGPLAAMEESVRVIRAEPAVYLPPAVLCWAAATAAGSLSILGVPLMVVGYGVYMAVVVDRLFPTSSTT